ncbi:DUF6716 putative glycosyltransferase [Salinibacterium sp. ZJ454]|uniref:DUF6716 putative glycosyltransferase n=1 Tax=Salinibacterium sp. ZJ454 TaxID=2708339 RepID=UPI0014228BBA|nr:DUF6716 putative glycosyltransferase [Salinibacterium sp. ZJ454]
MRAVAVVDTDSYAKWGASLLAAMPSAWQKRLLVLETPLAPSAEQLRTALTGTGIDAADVATVPFHQLRRELAGWQPDVVVASALGSVAEIVLSVAHDLPSPRPLLISGLPGIGIPVRKRAVVHRAQADLFLVHSRRERREFSELAEIQRIPMRFGLLTLPFLAPAVSAADATDVVFAAQALVPAERRDRQRVLDTLISLARRYPERRVVVKLRARAGEQQTHVERDAYDQLLTAHRTPPANLVLDHGPMARALDTAGALVTVSSTAALEALARGLPVLAIDDFGVGPEQINEIFVASNLLGSLDDLACGRFHSVDPKWLGDNYFHGTEHDDWLDQLDLLATKRDAGSLGARPGRPILGGALGAAWRRKRALGRFDRSLGGHVALAVGTVALPVYRGLKRVKRRASGPSGG